MYKTVFGFTPLTSPSEIIKDLTREVFRLTPFTVTNLLSASTISTALSETGKTLFPLSTLRGTPSSSKNPLYLLRKTQKKRCIKSAVPRNIINETFSIKGGICDVTTPFTGYHYFLPTLSFRSKRITSLPFLPLCRQP